MLVVTTHAQVSRPVTPATFVNVYNTVALDGDTLLLDAGTYSTAVAFPTGKSITLKANPAAATQPVVTFQLGEPTGSGGSLTFDSLMINRSGDYFFNSTAAQSMNRWRFVNCTIKNIVKSLYNSTNKTNNITNFTFDKCVISACGTNGTSFLLVSQTVDSLNLTNSTIYNYIGGDFFHPNNATTTKNISVSFINNTLYKCIWNNGYGWVSVGSLYPVGNTFLFRNNIFDQSSNTDPINNKPLLVYRGNGTATEQNNIKINYQGNNSTTTNATNLTLGTAPFVGITTIPYVDPAAGNFSLPGTSPFATAGVGGVPIGDPRWIKTLSQPVTVTAISSPAGAGMVTPAAALTVNKGDTVAFSAKRNFGYKFKRWQDSLGNIVSTDSSFRMAINANAKMIAVFDTITTYAFNVTIVGSTWGQVQLTPAPVNGRYERGTEVAMNVIPNFVTSFNFWENSSTATQRVVTVNEDKSFTATFDEIPFIVGWDFKAQSPSSSRPGDFYSETSNTGVINLLESVNGGTPSVVGWLPSPGGFSPSYPHLRFWSLGSNFKTTRRHLKAQFATTNYKNIQVKSMISGNYQAYSVMTMLYSLNDTLYTEFARVNMATTFGNTWANLNAMLPVAAENQPRVYIKWIADVTSPILNEGTDNDGTAITNILVFADKNVPLDTTAPVFISAVPVAGSSTATVNGAVVITFNEKVKAATSNITLDTTVLTGSYGSKTATFKYEKLSYDKEYTFTIPAGALTDMSGNVFAGLTYKFRTGKRSEPPKKLFDAVVAKDGTGDYLSVIDAITAAPSNRTVPWLIYIKNGVYTGHHDIPANKPFIHLIGQQRDSVIITDARLSGGPNAYSVNLGATMVVNPTDVYFENLTLENSWGYENLSGPQALALYALTNHFTINNVWLRSYQDTYLSAYSSNSDRQYLKNAKIEGAVDYIYGGGDVFFDRCTLTNNRPDGGFIVAPSHGAGTLWGYVFSNCTIDESPRITNGSNYFGRPWVNSPKTVFLNTTLKTGIKPAGWWYTFGTIPLIFADYNTMDANGNPVDLSQRISQYQYTSTVNGVPTVITGTAKSSLTDAEAASYTYENVTLRSGDTWDPRLMTEPPVTPANVVATSATIKWNTSAYSRLYIVFRNNKVLGFTIDTTYLDATAVSGQPYVYAVQAVGEFGALSGLKIASVALPLTGLELKAEKNASSVLLSFTTRSEINTSHFEVERSANGSTFITLPVQIKAAGNAQTANTYSFVDKQLFEDDVFYRIKAIDRDGRYSYSNSVLVRGSNTNNIVVYPSVSTGAITIVHPKANSVKKIDIYSMAGSKVMSISAKEGDATTTADVSSLSAGTYIVTFTSGAKNWKGMFIKQ